MNPVAEPCSELPAISPYPKHTSILSTSDDWNAFLRANNLQASMSRCGNCYDNAVAETFFQLRKRARIQRAEILSADPAIELPGKVMLAAMVGILAIIATASIISMIL